AGPSPVHRAALRRALRSGHRRRQLLRLRGPGRMDGLEVPGRARHPGHRPRPALPREVARQGRLGHGRGVGKAPRLRARGRLEAAAVHRRLVHGGGAGERRRLTTKETTMTKRAGLAAAVALTFSILGPGVRADVMPGDKITDQNMDKVKDLISPGMEWCIKRGFPMTIV